MGGTAAIFTLVVYDRWTKKTEGNANDLCVVTVQYYAHLPLTAGYSWKEMVTHYGLVTDLRKLDLISEISIAAFYIRMEYFTWIWHVIYFTKCNVNYRVLMS